MVQKTPEEIIENVLLNYSGNRLANLATFLILSLEQAGYTIRHRSSDYMPVLPIKPAKVELPRGGEEN